MTRPYFYDYDATTIKVDPVQVSASAKAITAATAHIVEQLDSISAQMKLLADNWTGSDPTSAAQLAEDFNKRWSDAMIALYGIEADPRSGILNVLVGGVSAAAMNYSKADQAVEDMFRAFYDSLNIPSSGNPSPWPEKVKPKHGLPKIKTDPVPEMIHHDGPGGLNGEHQSVVDTANIPYHSTSVNKQY